MKASFSLIDDLLSADRHNEYLAAKAQWRALISQLKLAMSQEGISKAEMASRMNMTDADFEAFLACGGDVIPFTLLHRAAGIVGRSIKIELI